MKKIPAITEKALAYFIMFCIGVFLLWYYNTPNTGTVQGLKPTPPPPTPPPDEKPQTSRKFFRIRPPA